MRYVTSLLFLLPLVAAQLPQSQLQSPWVQLFTETSRNSRVIPEKFGGVLYVAMEKLRKERFSELLPVALAIYQPHEDKYGDPAKRAEDLVRYVRYLTPNKEVCVAVGTEIQVPKHILVRHVFVHYGIYYHDDYEFKCILESARPSGTGYDGSLIRELRTTSAEACQDACQEEQECLHFHYLSQDYEQEADRNTCRLLREKGEERPDEPGNVSGPKYCEEKKKEHERDLGLGAQIKSFLKNNTMAEIVARCQDSTGRAALETELEKVLSMPGEGLGPAECQLEPEEMFLKIEQAIMKVLVKIVQSGKGGRVAALADMDDFWDQEGHKEKYIGRAVARAELLCEDLKNKSEEILD